MAEAFPRRGGHKNSFLFFFFDRMYCIPTKKWKVKNENAKNDLNPSPSTYFPSKNKRGGGVGE